MLKKGILLIVSIFLIIIISAAIFIKTDTFEKQLRLKLEKTISSVSEDSISIESITFKPYKGQIEFKNISSQKYGKVQNLKLNFSILKLLMNKLEIQKATVNNAEIRFDLNLDNEKKETPAFDSKSLFENLDLFFKNNHVNLLEFSNISLTVFSKKDNKQIVNLENVVGNVNYSSKLKTYTGKISSTKNNFNYNKINFPFALKTNFNLQKGSFSFENLNISSNENFVKINLKFTKGNSKIDGFIKIFPYDFVKNDLLKNSSVEIKLSGELEKLNGELFVKSDFGNLNGGVALETEKKEIHFSDCKCSYKEHNINISGFYNFKEKHYGNLKVHADGKYFKNIEVKGDFEKNNDWKYNFVGNLIDINGKTSQIFIKNFNKPVLKSVNLNLPFLKANIKDNIGYLNIFTKDFKINSSGSYLLENLFEGDATFNTFNLFGNVYPKFKGNFTALRSLKVIANSIMLFDSKEGYGKGTGWFTKDAMNLEMDLFSIDFKTALFVDEEIDELDIDGKINGNVIVKGDYDKIDVSGSVSLHSPLIFQTVFERVLADFRYYDDFLNIDNIYALNGKDGLKGNGKIDFIKETLDFHLKGENVNVLYLPVDFFKIFEANGSVDIIGTLENPIIKADFLFQNLVVGDRNLGNGQLNLNTIGNIIFLDTKTNGGLNVNTQVDFSGPIDFNVTANNLNVDLGTGFTGNFSANFIGKGDFNNLNTFLGNGTIINGKINGENNLEFSIKPTPIKLIGLNLFADEINLNYPDSQLSLKKTKLNLEDLALFGEINGEGKLQIIKNYINKNYDIDFDCNYKIDGQIAGTLENPTFQGNIRVSEGNALIPGLSFPITNISAVCNFDPSFLNINKMTATYGDGNAVVSGFVSNKGDLEIKTFFDKIPFDFSGIYAMLDGYIMLKNDLGNKLKATGKVNVNRCYIEESQILEASSSSESSQFFDNIKLEIALEVKDSEFENQYMHIFLNPSLISLKGTATSPILLGTLNFSNNSIIEINEIPMKISRGNIIFDNPFNINPFFNIMAETEIQGYNIVCRIKGDVNSQMSINFSSNPPLEKNQLFALLFGSAGVNTGSEYYYNDPTKSNSTDLTAAGLAMALNNLFSPFQKKVKEKFNVERIQITPQVFSEKGDPSPIITVEKDMSSRLTGTYSQTVSGAGENLIQFKYKTSIGNYLIIRKEIDSTYTLEFEFIKRD